MKFYRPVPTLLVLAGCAAGTMTTTVSGPSALAAEDAFDCARKELKAIDFEQSSYDVKDRRFTARRINESARRPEPSFHREVDFLTIQVLPAAGGSDGLSTLQVEAATFAELMTQRGPTQESEKVSETARNAAQTLLDRCSQAGDAGPGAASADSVPSAQ